MSSSKVFADKSNFDLKMPGTPKNEKFTRNCSLEGFPIGFSRAYLLSQTHIFEQKEAECLVASLLEDIVVGQPLQRDGSEGKIGASETRGACGRCLFLFFFSREWRWVLLYFLFLFFEGCMCFFCLWIF